jgi:hypothetical protein
LGGGLAVAVPKEAKAFENRFQQPAFFSVNGRFGFGVSGGRLGLNAGFDPVATAGVDLGFRVFKEAWHVKGQGDALYLGLTPQFTLAGYNALFLPFTAQYDIPLPVKGLYVYPRSEIGLGYCFDGCQDPYFAMSHMAGVKFHIHDKLQVGGDVGFLHHWIGGSDFGYFRTTAFVGGQFGK